MVLGLLLGLWVGIAVWVADDASRRGMNGVVWALGVFFLPIVVFPV